MVQPTLSDGTTTVTLTVDRNLPEKEEPKIVSLSIPERSGEILQFVGRNSKRIAIDGFTKVQAEKNTLRDWAKNGTALTYNDDENANINVRMLDFESERVPGVAGYYRFSFTLVEDE